MIRMEHSYDQYENVHIITAYDDQAEVIGFCWYTIENEETVYIEKLKSFSKGVGSIIIKHLLETNCRIKGQMQEGSEGFWIKMNARKISETDFQIG